jgi:hypothetical protein
MTAISLRKVLLGLAVVFVPLAAWAAAQEVQTRPFTVGAKVVDVRSATATSLSTLLGAVSGSAVIRISNPSAVLVCEGGSNLNMTLTVGGLCYPLCVAGATCADSALSFQTNIAQVYLQAAVDHTPVFVTYGGWM